jgi:hypothetical protein
MSNDECWEELSPSKPKQGDESWELVSPMKSISNHFPVGLADIIRQTIRNSWKSLDITLDSKEISELIQRKTLVEKASSSSSSSSKLDGEKREIILSENIDKPDRDAVMGMLVIFFFGPSTNTVVISEDKKGVATMCITNSFLSVMKNASISGKKGVFQKLRFVAGQFRSGPNCAKVLSKWLRIADLSLESNTKACISLDYFFQQCRILYLSFNADIQMGVEIVASLKPDWLNHMEETVDPSKVRAMPSGGRVPFKGTRFTDPVGKALGLGILDSETYKIIQRSQYYNQNNGLLEFFHFGTISPQAIPVMDGDLIQFEGWWRFTTKVNGIPTVASSKKPSNESNKSKKRKEKSKQKKKEKKNRKRLKKVIDDDEDEQEKEKYDEETDYGSDSDGSVNDI